MQLQQIRRQSAAGGIEVNCAGLEGAGLVEQKGKEQ